MTEPAPPPGPTPPPGFGPPPPQYAFPPPPQYAPTPPPPRHMPPPYGAVPAPVPASCPPAGPEFTAVDGSSAIAVDAEGVTLEVNGVFAEFPWPEIHSVHYRVSPNGKTLMLGVIHLDGHFYDAVVNARPRARLAEWCAHLPWVLGHYRPAG
ncbi:MULTISPECIES: hypothetical protein [unclassified Streptomyces]|uniref:hypothetical protein n=1 Tax=unclassified Streptomyces TaxID=2593676 RepID=UPI001F048D54|nr:MULTISPECIES: hypothetical protein [unclassified Streptomyces]MCH0563622.1 hypothetical protein [Streptomyces sp. MUM 2J]MCH0570755.1 hypothetical protein [Streptomyces sp. MUM 136J]